MPKILLMAERFLLLNTIERDPQRLNDQAVTASVVIITDSALLTVGDSGLNSVLEYIFSATFNFAIAADTELVIALIETI